jgi:hypothetical protein
VGPFASGRAVGRALGGCEGNKVARQHRSSAQASYDSQLKAEESTNRVETVFKKTFQRGKVCQSSRKEELRLLAARLMRAEL